MKHESNFMGAEEANIWLPQALTVYQRLLKLGKAWALEFAHLTTTQAKYWHQELYAAIPKVATDLQHATDPQQLDGSQAAEIADDGLSEWISHLADKKIEEYMQLEVVLRKMKAVLSTKSQMEMGTLHEDMERVTVLMDGRRRVGGLKVAIVPIISDIIQEREVVAMTDAADGDGAATPRPERMVTRFKEDLDVNEFEAKMARLKTALLSCRGCNLGPCVKTDMRTIALAVKEDFLKASSTTGLGNLREVFTTIIDTVPSAVTGGKAWMQMYDDAHEMRSELEKFEGLGANMAARVAKDKNRKGESSITLLVQDLSSEIGKRDWSSEDGLNNYVMAVKQRAESELALMKSERLGQQTVLCDKLAKRLAKEAESKGKAWYKKVASLKEGEQVSVKPVLEAAKQTLLKEDVSQLSSAKEETSKVTILLFRYFGNVQVFEAQPGRTIEWQW